MSETNTRPVSPDSVWAEQVGEKGHAVADGEMNIFEVLTKRDNFEECILIDFWSENLCRDMVFLIDNIWESPDRMREDLDSHDLFSLRCATVREVEIHNEFTSYMLAYPDDVNWGWNEFACVSAEQVDSQIHLRMIWEGGRHILIVADSVYVSRVSGDLERGQYQLAKRAINQ